MNKDTNKDNFKTPKKIYLVFLFAIFIVFAIHFVFALLPHFLLDESFYVTIPYRFVYGDRLIVEEWHLSQFSSFFTFIPVSLWLSITGSTNGLIVFIRILYLLIHTAVAFFVFIVFKKYRFWAVGAALAFYLQTPYKLYSISYNSMLALFLLILTLSLFYILNNHNSRRFIIISGAAFASCCICNPFFSLLLVIYLIIAYFFLLKKRQTCSLSCLTLNREMDSNKSSFDIFFSKNYILYFVFGLVVIGLSWTVFFFGAGGTFSSLFTYFGDMVASSEYGAMSESIIDKFVLIFNSFNKMTLNTPYLILILFLALLFNPFRFDSIKKFVCLVFVIIISIFCFIGMRTNLNDSRIFFLSLPLSLLSIVCYSLTKRKNKDLFICMWIPCVIAGIINLFTANTIFSSFGYVIAISNVAGVIFIRDFYLEVKEQKHNSDSKRPLVKVMSISSIALLTLISLSQIALDFYVIQFGQPLSSNMVLAEKGPYSGVFMTEQHYQHYINSLNDLDYIKEISDISDPVFIASNQSWMYLYLDRPIATYTTWFEGHINILSLTSYYKHSPNKIPRYVYVPNMDIIEAVDFYYDNRAATMEEINYLFDYSSSEFSNGLFLTIIEYHPGGKENENE